MDEYESAPKNLQQDMSKSPAPERKNRHFLILILSVSAVVLAIGSTALWIVWSYGFLSDEPDVVVRKAVFYANKGQNDKVRQLLPDEEKIFFESQPETFETLLDQLTDGGKVTHVSAEILAEQKFDTIQVVFCRIQYKHGKALSISTSVYLENGSWRVSLMSLLRPNAR